MGCRDAVGRKASTTTVYCTRVGSGGAGSGGGERFARRHPRAHANTSDAPRQGQARVMRPTPSRGASSGRWCRPRRIPWRTRRRRRPGRARRLHRRHHSRPTAARGRWPCAATPARVRLPHWGCRTAGPGWAALRAPCRGPRAAARRLAPSRAGSSRVARRRARARRRATRARRAPRARSAAVATTAERRRSRRCRRPGRGSTVRCRRRRGPHGR
jgi:hypothetical protein